MTVESYNFVVYDKVTPHITKVQIGTLVIPTYIDARDKLRSRFPNGNISICRNGFLEKHTLEHLPTCTIGTVEKG